MNEFNEWVLKETGTYISSSSGPWRLAQNAWEFQDEKIKALEKKLEDARETMKKHVCLVDIGGLKECLKRLEEK
jgi:hypothetical protein